MAHYQIVLQPQGGVGNALQDDAGNALPDGGPGRTRTACLLHAMQVLFRMSYRPTMR